MTDEEKFRFDLTGFLVRPAFLEPDEVADIVDQVDRIHNDPDSLSPEERAVPGGAASVLIDHPDPIFGYRVAALPRQKQAYFREPWIADFWKRPVVSNSIEHFIESDEPIVNTDI